MPFTARNRFVAPNATFDCHCGANFTGPGSFDALQAVGLDLGSTVEDMISVDEMMALGRAALGMDPR